MQTPNYYFAYGSNLSSLRLRARVSLAQVVCVARLENNVMQFSKLSIDGSAKCDITLQAFATTWGVVYQLADTDWPLLDGFEGVPVHYQRESVTVISRERKLLTATAYRAVQSSAIALDCATVMQPYEWYKEHVLRGAIEHALPESYINKLRTIETKPDPDKERATMEMAIHLVD